MTRPPANASEWTTAVEAAVQTELLRRSRRLKWAVVLSLLVGALAVGLAISLRGMTWEEIAPRVVQATEPVVQQRLAPVLNAQITQGQVQLDLQAELGRLEAEIAQLRNEVLAPRNAVDPQVAALQRRMLQAERALNEALAERARLASRLDRLVAAPAPPPSAPAH